MGQFSMKILPDTGSRFDVNQQPRLRISLGLRNRRAVSRGDGRPRRTGSRRHHLPNVCRPRRPADAGLLPCHAPTAEAALSTGSDHLGL